uniref:Uncharacterized protein n=1 Tax=Strigamia maritima TaxID=126957 RepID=T1IVT9_STRMM
FLQFALEEQNEQSRYSHIYCAEAQFICYTEHSNLAIMKKLMLCLLLVVALVEMSQQACNYNPACRCNQIQGQFCGNGGNCKWGYVYECQRGTGAACEYGRRNSCAQCGRLYC